MSANRTAQSLILTVCVLLLAGCAKKASDEIDLGTFEKSVYRNQYFGFNVTLPADWAVQDQESRERLAEVGKKVLAGDDRRMKAVLKASEQQSVNLLAAFKHPIGTPVAFNPNLICTAERLHGFSGIKSGKDYLYHARKLMESSQMQVEFAKDVSTEELGGLDFDIMHGSITFGALTVQQKFYATILKDYALVFITSCNAPDQQSALQNILQTVSFKQP
jgi:hypothetical protein